MKEKKPQAEGCVNPTLVTEADTLNAVLEYLILLRIPYARVNNTGTIIRRDGKTFFGTRKHSQRGVADVIACFKGRALALEIKATGKKPGPEQREWGDSWVRGGGEYHVIDGLDKLMRITGS